MATRFFPNYKANLITSRFGMRTLKGETRMHNGIDMTATNDGETGQVDDITAHTGGVVESNGYNSSAGNYVRVRVDNKTLMVYYHLKNRSPLKVGTAIKAGQIVGRMGKTGNTTGRHLHWGIQYNGKWIDPEPYLDKDWEKPQETCSVTLPILRNGDKSDAVRSMQILLAENGHKGEMNENAYGSFGGKTENALKSYQQSVGLPVSGECEKETWTKLIGG